MHSAHHWDKGGENRRPFAERNDGRSPATHFTWFLAALALRLPLEGVTNPPESTESGSSCDTLCLCDLLLSLQWPETMLWPLSTKQEPHYLRRLLGGVLIIYLKYRLIICVCECVTEFENSRRLHTGQSGFHWMQFHYYAFHERWEELTSKLRVCTGCICYDI